MLYYHNRSILLSGGNTMSYKAFLGTVCTPVNSKKYSLLPFEPSYKSKRNLDRYCLDFIRNECESLYIEDPEMLNDLKDEKTIDSIDIESYRNALKRDTDRLCLERSLHQFAVSGSKETAFDVYFSFCEIFRPFGKKYSTSRILLEVLAEHESNASSLMMKHRDHYSHSVYVFMIGIAVFANNEELRNAFYEKYCPDEKNTSRKNGEFLRLWGMAALFHDIGYPFEIAHQQIQAFFEKLRFASKSLFVSYQSWNHTDKYLADESKLEYPDEFLSISSDDLKKLKDYDPCSDNSINRYFAVQLYERMKDYCGYPGDKTPEEIIADIRTTLDNKTVDSPKFMDHAYFSGVMLFKNMLDSKIEITSAEMDVICAILLHNSLFKFYFRKKGKPLSLCDGQPIAYLLMLCDELQCWDRTAYGQNTRSEISPWDFDLTFHKGKLRTVYYFDEMLFDKTLRSKAYKQMIDDNGSEYKFVKDIAEIVDLGQNHTLLRVQPVFVPKKRYTGSYLSDTTYMDLYQLAIVLNGRYNNFIEVQYKNKKNEDKTFSTYLSYDTIETIYNKTDEESKKISEKMREKLQEDFEGLSLEMKLSNIDQARAFAAFLEKINCFYTSRNVDYDILTDFSKEEIEKLALLEHDRWINEKTEMGWQYGTYYLAQESDDSDNRPYTLGDLIKVYQNLAKGDKIRIWKDFGIRELCRRHKDLVSLDKLTETDILKDTEPMRCIVKLLNIIEGIHIYRR